MRRVLAMALGISLVGAPGPLRASPAGPSELDLAHAKQVYEAAEQEVAAGQLAAALADYEIAYDLSKDAALLFKLGSANDKLGRCENAVFYYERYLGAPHIDQKFAWTAADRIAACAVLRPNSSPNPGLNATPNPNPTPAPMPDPKPNPKPKPNPAPLIGHGSRGGWLLVGTSVAFATLGVVLAYAASSSQDDIRDLYAPLGTAPAVYTVATAQRYQQLIDEGHRYEYLSWASLGLAAATAIGAAVVFTHGHGGLEVAPVVTPRGAGVAAGLRF